MLTEVTKILATGESAAETMTAVAVRRPRATHERLHAAVESFSWPNDLVVTDRGTGYDVRLSVEAIAEIRAEVRRGARVRGPRIETGGMLLGTIDESTGIVSVDLATGPAPDSKLSNSYFFHGTAGTQELIERYSQQTGGITGFLGIWHTHPGGPALPSQMDLDGMSALTTFTPTVHRALMMILGGTPEVWNTWTEADGQPDIYVQVIERDAGTAFAATPSPADQQQVPLGHYFPGGFSTPSGDPLPRRRRRWFWWRKR
jgi:integrative and conjugative element protein (TIGR02256 family)